MPSEQSFAGDRLSVAFSSVGPALDYLIDLSQRTILFWDVMRQRGNGYREQRLIPLTPGLRNMVTCGAPWHKNK